MRSDANGEPPHLNADIDPGEPLSSGTPPHQAPSPSPRDASVEPRRLSWGNYLARGTLIALAFLGLLFSTVPWGRASFRTIMLVPELVATRPLAPIAAAGEPIRHVSLTISSEAGPVYLDVWA